MSSALERCDRKLRRLRAASTRTGTSSRRRRWRSGRGGPPEGKLAEGCSADRIDEDGNIISQEEMDRRARLRLLSRPTVARSRACSRRGELRPCR